MKKIDLGQIIQIVASVGVVVGLVFLVVEINQNTQATNTASRDAAVEHVLHFFEQSMDSQVIARAQHKMESGGELDDFEKQQLWRYQYYNFKIFENIHIQYQQGLFSDGEWNRYRIIIKGVLENNEFALDMWKSTTGHWTEEFHAELDDLMSDR